MCNFNCKACVDKMTPKCCRGCCEAIDDEMVNCCGNRQKKQELRQKLKHQKSVSLTDLMMEQPSAQKLKAQPQLIEAVAKKFHSTGAKVLNETLQLEPIPEVEEFKEQLNSLEGSIEEDKLEIQPQAPADLLKLKLMDT